MQKESITSILSKVFKNQAELACVIGEGTITRASRLKAYRIWHGIRKPNDFQMMLIDSATNGKLDANFFCGLSKPKAKGKNK